MIIPKQQINIIKMFFRMMLQLCIVIFELQKTDVFKTKNFDFNSIKIRYDTSKCIFHIEYVINFKTIE